MARMMTRKNILAMVLSVAAMLSLAMLASCTMVEFEGDPVETFDGIEKLNQNRMSKISFAIQWPSNIPDSEKPEYLTVVMNRIQNTAAHYVYYLDAEGNIMESFDAPTPPESPETPEEPEIPNDTDSDSPADGSESDGENGDESGDGEDTSGEGAEDGATDGEAGEDSGAGDGENDGAAGDESNEGTNEGAGEGADDGDGNDEGEDRGDSEEDDGTGEGEEVQSPDMIHNGYYSIAAVGVTDYQDFIVPDIQKFEESLEVKMRDVYVTVPQISKEERLEKNYIDFNPVYPYIRQTGPFYYVRPSAESHAMVATGKENTIQLNPQLLTRKIRFKVTVNLEEGVTINRFVGTISGVPQQVHLMTGNVSENNTGKMPFEMTSTDGKTYEGYVNAFGLFPSENTELIVGPGILTVTLHATAEKDGVIHSRIFYASLNIKNEIDAAEIMRQTEDKTAYRFSDMADSDEGVLSAKIKDYDIIVQQNLAVTRDKILYGTDQGFEEWMPNDSTDDGLNPEV